jgi:DNA-binding NtrC family response regulator
MLYEPVLRERENASTNLIQELGLKEFIGRSPKFMAVVKSIPKVAQCDVTVLITGETGTGKELCARAIHYLSQRAGHPFIPVDSGAIPLQLFESEFFGHEKGAFTDAKEKKIGLVAEAEGGTLFIDEVETLDLKSQVKLLRFLQNRSYRPLGNTKLQKANVRLIAASNTDLSERISDCTFRDDLFYRLNIVDLVLPPLRERKEDIPLIAIFFLTKYASEIKEMAGFSDDAMRKLLSHNYPGNIRELENIVQRAIVLSSGSIIKPEDISLPAVRIASAHARTFKEAKELAIAEFEKNFIRELLSLYHGNITRAANAVGKERSAFGKLVRKYDIDTALYKSTH